MKAHDIRQMSEEDIQAKLGELREAYFKLTFRHAVHKIDNPMQIRALRKEIARCLTILQQKQGQQAAS